MKRILFIPTLALSFCGMSQEVVENPSTAVFVATERQAEPILETPTPLSKEVVENEENIITTIIYKNITVVKTEPKH